MSERILIPQITKGKCSKRKFNNKKQAGDESGEKRSNPNEAGDMIDTNPIRNKKKEDIKPNEAGSSFLV